MAYFRENEIEDTRQQPPIEFSEDSRKEVRGNPEMQEYMESDYDDGFDDPDETEEETLSEEEQKEIREKRFRVMSRAGNLAAVIAGTVVILILLALLMNMIGFVLNDADRNFTLFQTRL